MQALSNAICTAQDDASIQSLILQSSNPKIFSAGLDLMELHNPSLERLVEFWSSFQQLYLDLYGSRLACIAAMEGHSPAAGCMLALSCDYRILIDSSATPNNDKKKQPAPPPTIGLNESQLGIVAPPWLAQQMMDVTGRRCAELSLQLGLLYTPHDALTIGLVDQLSLHVREDSVTVAKQWSRIPPQARVASKLLFRKERMERLLARRQEDIDHFVGFVTTKKVQTNLSAYLEKLQAKKK
jgi:3,2-trans-enoyl-CoA isomerase